MHHHGKHLQRRQQAVSGGGFLQKDDVTRLFAAEHVATLAHGLDDVAVADRRAQQLALLGGQRAFEPKV